jgi:acetyl/propionyl-CoA carboxylase alpha subunit
MFKKLLITNRGEIAVRIIRTCREMGISTVALYEAADRDSLHVRLADECAPLTTPAGFIDHQALLAIAQRVGADALHPGYGFLAEDVAFIRACDAAGVAFIGPSAEIVDGAREKVKALAQVKAAGFPTVEHSPASFGAGELDQVRAAAEALGYPLVIKSCSGGRGRGEKLVRHAAKLEEALRRAQAEAQAVYGNQRIYLERALLGAHQLCVQIVADQYGNLIHLGEREGSLIYGNQKLLVESPAPALKPETRAQMREAALAIARLFNYQNVGAVEFLVNAVGEFFFTEIKARIQMDHPVAEMVSRVDLVREQIRLRAGRRLNRAQAEVALSGHALQCRLSAEDPWHNFMPTPGPLRRVRVPDGPDVRVDTFAYSGCEVPPNYDPLIAKLIVWGADRASGVARLQRALAEFHLLGPANTLPLLQRLVQSPAFVQGVYDTEFLAHAFPEIAPDPAQLRDLAVIAAVCYARRAQAFTPAQPARLQTGWHRESRRLPQ